MFVLYLGLMLCLGVIGGKLANAIRLPAITGYVVVGVILGPSALAIIPESILTDIGHIEEIALTTIALSIGAELRYGFLKKVGSNIITITIFQALGAFCLVSLAVWASGQQLPLALLLGALATATAPAATLAVIKEYKAKGSFTNSLLAVVALDDALCVVIFSLTTAVAGVLSSDNIRLGQVIGHSVSEIIFSVLLGITSGLLIVYLANRLKSKDRLIALLSLTFLTAGLATVLELSLILTVIVLGATFGNLYKKAHSLLETMETIELPIYITFFTFAGTQLQLGAVSSLGVMGIAYVLARVAGKVGGAYLGASLTRAPKPVRNYLGLGLIPQAGVAIGLALVAGQNFPELRPAILNVILASVVIYEIVGPIAAKIALRKAGDIEDSRLQQYGSQELTVEQGS